MNNALIDISGYNVQGLLGKGGMAEVYLAVQNSLNRKVAIKVLLDNNEPGFNQRFINEGHLIASLHHPAIITIYDINQLDDGRYYLAMEFVGGGDLAQYAGQVFAPSRALALVKQVAEGLQVVHDKGLVHRDIKPANILFRHENSVVITDFGIAKNLEIDSELTQQGIVVGSPSYSSPEQAQCQPLDHRTDIYSLGVVLAELLTGRNPFKGESYTQTVINHVTGPIPQLPEELRQYQPLLNKMLAKNPDQRFASCREVVEAIQRISNTAAAANDSAQDDTTAQRPVIALPGMPKFQSLASRFHAIPARLRWTGLSIAVLLAVLAINYPLIARQVDIRLFLHKAELSLAANHLTKPAEDNAAYYYRKVLELQADQPEALAGMHNIAVHFLEKSQAAFQQGDYTTGLKNLDKGLSIEPDNEDLLQLRKQYVQPADNNERAAQSGGTAKNPFKKLWQKMKQL